LQVVALAQQAITQVVVVEQADIELILALVVVVHLPNLH
jgi:hypothetical protein